MDYREQQIRQRESDRCAFRSRYPGTPTRAHGDEDVAYLLGLVSQLRAEVERLVRSEWISRGPFTGERVER